MNIDCRLYWVLAMHRPKSAAYKAPAISPWLVHSATDLINITSAEY